MVNGLSFIITSYLYSIFLLPALDIMKLNSSSSSDSTFLLTTFLWALCWLYSSPSIVLPADMNCKVMIALRRSLLHWLRISRSCPSLMHSSSPSAMAFKTRSIDFSVGGFMLNTKKLSFRSWRRSRAKSLLWKVDRRSWESDSVKITKGVAKGLKTIDFKASLKSLINSKRRAWKIFKHNRKPFITITLRYLLSTLDTYWTGAWNVFLAVKLEVLIPYAFELPWALALILRKWMRFSRSFGYELL